MGGLAVAAKYDAREITKPARKAFLARFEREVDPEGVLEPAERKRRATAAMKLHMAQLSWRAATAKRAKSKARRRPTVDPGVADSSKDAG